MFNLFIQLILPFALYSFALADDSAKLPTVNLGYELHQASSFNSVGAFYNFSNIRYADPPVGNLRFRAPVPPRGRSTSVNQGTVGRICPQASPAWSLIAGQIVEAFALGKPFNVSAAGAASANGSSTLPPQDPRTTEDCLFLDIIVPQKIFDRSGNKEKSAAPVLVWVHGGAFVTGEKTSNGLSNPAGLLNMSQAGGFEGFVFVTINYRLGAFGWLAGSDLQADGTANAGLYDQRLALLWVQRNIHLFGGDSKKVTVIGESAGAASIIHQITAFGGLKGPAPFQQAIIQSPAFSNTPSSLQQQQAFEGFLSTLKVETLAEARQLPSTDLITANIIEVGRAPYGSANYGVVVDGLFAPALPGKLFRQGSFDQSLNVMVAHNTNETPYFTNPAVQNNSAYNEYIRLGFPDISPSVADYIEKVLYPPVFDGSYGYTDQFGRSALAISDSSFTCNTNYLNRAFQGKSYAYVFSVPPAVHGQDVAYTFYTGSDPAAVVSPPIASPIAEALQAYIVSFAATGVPSGEGLPLFPQWGNATNLLDLNVTGIKVVKDPTANTRCTWWQKALYY